MNIKIYSFIAAVCLTSLAQAQEISPTDIMNYNGSDMNGTARFKGMSGAFGALGGDLSALKINPAGSAFFNYNSTAFSLAFVNKNNKSDYNGSKEKENDTDFDLSQLGAVFVFNSNNPNAVVRRFTIGLNYENTKNLSNNYFFRGQNGSTNVNDYLYGAAQYGNNGNPINIQDIQQIGDNHINGYNDAGYYNGLSGQNAYLAYHSGLISYNNGYTKNYNENSATIQARDNRTTGNTGSFSGNFGAQIGERFYVGTNLNVKTVDYTQNSVVSERVVSPTNSQNVVQTDYGNSIYTHGTGFSFNLGVIGQITDNLRAGLSYESPTWYNLYDETTQFIKTSFANDNSKIIAPNIVNLYDKYQVTTPSQYTGSLAYIFGDKALLSLDYSVKDYRNNKFKPTHDATYNIINQSIQSNMQTASELRIGGEYRLNAVSLRAGYRYEQSPYKTDKLVGDLQSFSAGIGYTFGPSRLDLSYAFTARDYQASLLDLTYNSASPTANVKLKENWINLTYNISF